MAKVAEETGVYKRQNADERFILAITAGVFISIAFVFYIAAATTRLLPRCLSGAKTDRGICFSLGLILCVICGADLFTSTGTYRRGESQRTDYRVNWQETGLNVYVGNLIGCFLFVLLMWLSGAYMTANGAWGLNVRKPPTTKCTIHLLKPCVWVSGWPDGLSGGVDELLRPQPDG